MLNTLSSYNKAVFGSLSIPFAQSAAEPITTVAMYAVSLIGLDMPPNVQAAVNTLIGMAISGLVIGASANLPKPYNLTDVAPTPTARINVLTDIAEKKP